jgi:hypothetical protein
MSNNNSQSLVTIVTGPCPAAASAMGYLVGGDLLIRMMFARDAAGFDLTNFNDFTLATLLTIWRPHDALSGDVELLRFDFSAHEFPFESRHLAIVFRSQSRWRQDVVELSVRRDRAQIYVDFSKSGDLQNNVFVPRRARCGGAARGSGRATVDVVSRRPSPRLVSWAKRSSPADLSMTEIVAILAGQGCCRAA